MKADERAAVASEVLDNLLQFTSAGTITGEMVEAELAAIGPRGAANVIGLGGGWPLVRTRVYATFGTLEAARDYYENSCVDTRFFGKKVVVHKLMADALARAEAKYAALGGDPATLKINSIGGLAIRSNANNASALSDHSFGWAVDIDGMDQKVGAGVAAGNPNTKESRIAGEGIPDFWEFVKEITGEDVFKRNAKGERISDSAPGLADDRVDEPDRLQALSDRLMAMFADEAALTRAMISYVGLRGIRVPAGGGSTLSGLSLAAARLGPPRGRKDRNRSARDGYLAALGQQLQTWFNAPDEDGKVVVGPIDSWNIANRLFQMGLMFLASGNAEGGAATPNALAAGTLGSIAAHGFMNLDPLLVGALNSTDGGGGLRWLGGAVGTKDFMHFELVDPPPIVKAPVPAT
jgi:hypothetical protein